MNKKSVLIILLAMIMCFALSACGDSKAEIKGAYWVNSPSNIGEVDPDYKYLIVPFELTNTGDDIDMTGDNSASVTIGGETIDSLTSSVDAIANYYTYSGYSEIKVIPDDGSQYGSYSKTTYSDAFAKDETRILAAVFVVEADLITDGTVEMTYAIGEISETLKIGEIEEVTFLDETMKWEEDFSTAQMARSYIWRLNTLSLMNTELRTHALKGAIQYTGNNYSSMSNKLKNLLATDVKYGVSYSEEPTWGFSSAHPSGMIAGEVLPVLDYDVIESVYPGTKEINERLHKNAVKMADVIRTHGSLTSFTDACVAISEDLRTLDSMIDEEIYMLSD